MWGAIINTLKLVAQAAGWMSAGYVASDIVDLSTQSSGNPAAGNSSASKRISWIQSITGVEGIAGRLIVWVLLLAVAYYAIKNFKFSTR